MSRRATAILSILAASMTLFGCGSHRSSPVVAVLLPLSGPHAKAGEAVRRGVELEMSRLRSEQGGAEVRLEVVDTEGRASRAAALTEELSERGAVAFIGGVTRAEAEAIGRVAATNERVFLSLSSGFEPTGRYAFRLVPSSEVSAVSLAGFVARTMERSRVVTVGPGGQRDGSAMAFARELERNGAEVSDRVTYGPVLGDRDAVVARVLEAGPEVVFVTGPGEAVSRLIRGLADRRFRGTILTSSLLGVEDLGAEAGTGRPTLLLARAPVEMKAEDPVVAEFVESYETRYGSEPGLYAAYGADAISALHAGWTHPDGGLHPEKLWRGLRFTSELRGVTGHLQFDEGGEITVYPRIYRVEESGEVRLDEIKLAARRDAARARRG